jgi:hypothetical protein
MCACARYTLKSPEEKLCTASFFQKSDAKTKPCLANFPKKPLNRLCPTGNKKTTYPQKKWMAPTCAHPCFWLFGLLPTSFFMCQTFDFAHEKFLSTAKCHAY